jgi:hypothetical protein
MASPKHILIGSALLVSAISLAVMESLGTVYTTEETKSRFLSSYDPTTVIRRFEPSLSWGGGLSSSAGSVLPWERRDVAYNSEFKWLLHPDDPRHMVIVAALLEETRRSLLVSGAQIVQEQADDSGFTIVYCVGRSTGRISTNWPKKGTRPKTDGPFTLTVKERFRV